MSSVHAAGMAVFCGGQLLLAKHSRDRRWATPGGGVEKGESAEAAARREVSEEVGLSLGGRAFLESFGGQPMYDIT